MQLENCDVSSTGHPARRSAIRKFPCPPRCQSVTCANSAYARACWEPYRPRGFGLPRRKERIMATKKLSLLLVALLTCASQPALTQGGGAGGALRSGGASSGAASPGSAGRAGGQAGAPGATSGQKSVPPAALQMIEAPRPLRMRHRQLGREFRRAAASVRLRTGDPSGPWALVPARPNSHIECQSELLSSGFRARSGALQSGPSDAGPPVGVCPTAAARTLRQTMRPFKANKKAAQSGRLSLRKGSSHL